MGGNKYWCFIFILKFFQFHFHFLKMFPKNIVKTNIIRGRSRIAATYKMELFVIIFNGFQLLTIIKKGSTLDVSAVLDPPLITDDY